MSNTCADTKAAPSVVTRRRLVLEPQSGSSWASEMVLNPAIIEDPQSGRIHMLFRATGPCPEKQTRGKPLPFPIFLGYGWSDDRGRSWQVDHSRPALAPRAATQIEDIYINNISGKRVVNHANGCIEDPRLFFLEGECYAVTACRMFPPGPYWINDEPMQCAPEWARLKQHPFGPAASENVTVNVLFRVDLKELAAHNYERAFQYVTPLTNPERGEDRDVILFPERLCINGRNMFVALHRPWNPQGYAAIGVKTPPSIVACASHTLDGLWKEEESQCLLATPAFTWEADRIGASAPLLKLSAKEWLLSYHGKQNAARGYSQSFMILETRENGLPAVKHRCPLPIMRPQESWEMPDRFKSPVVFITGMLEIDGSLMVSYGAADQRVGVAEINFEKLLAYIRRFDQLGREL